MTPEKIIEWSFSHLYVCQGRRTNYVDDIMNISDLTDYAREEDLEFGNNRTKTSLQATVFC